MIDIFCNGTTIINNPSQYGGAWSYVTIEDGKVKTANDGIITTEQAGQPITNNFIELYAALLAIESAPCYHQITLYTTSKVTMLRLKRKAAMNGIPQTIIDRLEKQKITQRFKVELASDRKALREIAKTKNNQGRTVSKWNLYCYDICKEQEQLWIKGNADALDCRDASNKAMLDLACDGATARCQ